MVMPAQRRSSFQVMRDTVSALMIRELKTRFGSTRLGYFWAIVEPALQASIIAMVFMLVGRSSLTGVPVILFIIIGILPFKGFIRITGQLLHSINSNKALFSYRQVSPIDPFVTRLIIEAATHTIVFFLILGLLFLAGFNVYPEKPLELILVNVITLVMASGIGLILCSVAAFYTDISKIWSLSTQPFFFLSGVFFAVTMIPAQFWIYITWNPLLHITELSRDAMFKSYNTPVGDWWYLIKICISVWGLGISLYWINRQRFIAS